MRKATRKLITQGISVVLLLTTLFFGVWCTVSNAFGFNVVVTYEIPRVYGVMRNLDEDPLTSEWTRTDDSVGLTAEANQFASVEEYNTSGPATDNFAMAIHGGTLPFYKDIDIVNMRVSDGEIVAHLGDPNFVWTSTNGASEQIDVMTYYPGHYIKRWQAQVEENTYEYIQLSTANFDGAQYVAPYYRGTFKAIYTGSKLRSYAGGDTPPTGNKTIGTFRADAKSQGMYIGDWRDFDFLCLYLIKYADYNSQTKVGPGITNSINVGINGLGSAHTTLQGRDGYIGENADQTSVWCLGLCDFWGNQWEFVDGIAINAKVVCVATDPDDYTNLATPTTPGYTNIGYPTFDSDGYPKSTGYDSSNQLIAFPTESGGSESTGLCDDYCYPNTGVHVVLRGGNCAGTTGAGAFYFTCNNVFDLATFSVGCRLLKTA